LFSIDASYRRALLISVVD